jgi:hypothetical protein
MIQFLLRTSIIYQFVFLITLFDYKMAAAMIPLAVLVVEKLVNAINTNNRKSTNSQSPE